MQSSNLDFQEEQYFAPPLRIMAILSAAGVDSETMCQFQKYLRV